ncbi:hypothetical protein J437_LFUL014347 [Ladona fulva]|uniref:CRAL-TRIO domain-containing protein n=1 Tax=Ladona fulva TaxID=123851 RepID=A0A8K0KHR4_LADFU|nr:hypothetical protein J437_LFUL014347 [Ladona fulva]
MISCGGLEMSSKMLSEIKELPKIQLGNFVLQFELEDLDDELQEKARKELRETPELTKESLQELRELLKEEADLNIPIDNDNFLIRFLRPCKFYPQSAFELKWKPNKVTLDEVFKGCVLFLEAAMIEPRSQVNGCIVIFDMDSLTLQQVWQFTPPFAKRIVDWLQDSIPMRVKAIHIVNQPYIFNMVFALFKPFLREKLRSRIYFHGNDRDSLFQHVEPKYLPECYDGTLEIPRISGNEWLELLLQCDKEYEGRLFFHQRIKSYDIKTSSS